MGPLHLSMPGARWTRCADEKVKAEQRDVAKEWSLFSCIVQCVVVFSAHMRGPLLASDGFCRAQCVSALEVAVAWVESVSAGEAGKCWHTAPYLQHLAHLGGAWEETDPYKFHWQGDRAELNAGLAQMVSLGLSWRVKNTPFSMWAMRCLGLCLSDR